MSYCRFGWDGSDVYVIRAGDNRIQCVNCGLAHPDRAYYWSRSEQEMIVHLLAHREAGDSVPQEAIERLEAERDGEQS